MESAEEATRGQEHGDRHDVESSKSILKIDSHVIELLTMI